MFKKIVVAAFFLFLVVLPVSAQESAVIVTVEVFERLDCAHCQAEKAFLTELDAARADVEVTFYDIADPQNRQLWSQLSETEKLSKVTPTTVVANTIIQGFADRDTTGKRIEQLIDQAKTVEQKTAAEIIAAGGTGNVETVAGAVCDDGLGTCETGPQGFIVDVPLVGSIDVGKYSLAAMSMTLGFVDGFNPCAMWVLVTFLILLMQVGDKRKMWEMAGLFIIAEAIMYYLILNVWFTAWDFVGLDQLVTPLVGLLAVGSGVYFVYEGWTSDGTCQVTSTGQKKKITQRIKTFVQSPLTLASAVGIIGIAFAVNVIEFACSIGVPQAFTKVLEINNLGWLQTQWYMALYILFYMADDFIVFGLALYSFEKIGLTTKYSKWSNLFGGVLMVLLGVVLLFKREWLIF